MRRTRGFIDLIFDVVEGLPQGKALDMAEGAPLLAADSGIHPNRLRLLMQTPAGQQ